MATEPAEQLPPEEQADHSGPITHPDDLLDDAEAGDDPGG